MQENTPPFDLDHVQLGSSSTELEPVERRAEIAMQSSKYVSDIKKFVAESADIVAVIDPAGRMQAHRIGMSLKSVRVEIEKTGKAAREDATKFNKAVIAKEKELIALVEPEEERVLSLRDRYDAKVKAEKEAAEKAERERKGAIEAKLAAIRNEPLRAAGQSAQTIAGMRVELENEAPSAEFFEEYFQRALEVHADALAKLTAQHEAQLILEQNAARAKAEAEAEAARVAAQAEENRKAAVELQRQRDDIERERQAIAAARAADDKRLADEQQAAQAKIAAAQKAAQDKLDAAEAQLNSEREAFIREQEAVRMASMPVADVVAALDGPEEAHGTALAGIDQDDPAPIQDQAESAPQAAPVPRVPVPEPKQVTAFRIAVRDLLDITDAAEIFVLLSDELERALQAEAA